MRQLIERLRNKSVYTPKLAIARFLVAFGMLLFISFNDMSIVANHNYTHLKRFRTRDVAHASSHLKSTNLFMMMPPARAKMVVIIILLLVMSGLLPQLTGPLHVWASFSIITYFTVLNGGDKIAFVLSILLLPLCLTDPRLNQWKRKEQQPSNRNIFANVALFAIQVQAAIIYLDSAISKLLVKEWRDGTAIYYYTSDYRLGAPDWLRSINETITLTPLVALLSWGAIILELLLFACLFATARVKKVFLVIALFFHFLIAVNFGLIPFFFSMAALLILYLDDENNAEKLLPRSL